LAIINKAQAFPEDMVPEFISFKNADTNRPDNNSNEHCKEVM
ncbi:MAG: hypothetical protein ACI9YE_003859, partial [Psychroserpens sp.]